MARPRYLQTRFDTDAITSLGFSRLLVSAMMVHEAVMVMVRRQEDGRASGLISPGRPVLSGLPAAGYPTAPALLRSTLLDVQSYLSGKKRE